MNFEIIASLFFAAAVIGAMGLCRDANKLGTKT